MSRLNKTFKAFRRAERTGLVTYVTAGDPTVARTESILRTLDASGADVLEIGVPFSDPLADASKVRSMDSVRATVGSPAVT
jgi:tryptophan synthase alpha chain